VVEEGTAVVVEAATAVGVVEVSAADTVVVSAVVMADADGDVVGAGVAVGVMDMG
jgi:hypothetical protein